MNTIKIGSLVYTPFKNRWGLECAGTVRQINDEKETANVEVWNINGPGANQVILDIPFYELTLHKEQNDKIQ